MANVPLDKRFYGQTRLLKTLLWRQGLSTDLDVCFDYTKKAGFINADDEEFLRTAFEMLDQMDAEVDLDPPLTPEFVDRLQLCVMKLNSADAG